MLDVLKRGHTTIAEKPAPLHKIGVQLLFQQSSWLHAQAHVQRVSKHNLAAAPEQKNIPQNGDDDTQTLDAQVPAILDLEEMRQAEPWLPRPALRAGGAASSTDLSNVACACVAMLIHHRTPSASGVLSGEHATVAGPPRFAAAPPGGGGGGVVRGHTTDATHADQSATLCSAFVPRQGLMSWCTGLRSMCICAECSRVAQCPPRRGCRLAGRCFSIPPP